jgi:hypothetical protein
MQWSIHDVSSLFSIHRTILCIFREYGSVPRLRLTYFDVVGTKNLSLLSPEPDKVRNYTTNWSRMVSSRRKRYLDFGNETGHWLKTEILARGIKGEASEPSGSQSVDWCRAPKWSTWAGCSWYKATLRRYLQFKTRPGGVLWAVDRGWFADEHRSCDNARKERYTGLRAGHTSESKPDTTLSTVYLTLLGRVNPAGHLTSTIRTNIVTERAICHIISPTCVENPSLMVVTAS